MPISQYWIPFEEKIRFSLRNAWITIKLELLKKNEPLGRVQYWFHMGKFVLVSVEQTFARLEK